ncbi:hypothetical protein [Candidatus Uabimicrobium amorphum]|uniref:Uncharacterized protein n=1 Tax=Uabimicrobium amorphum TaxID=2596890 RepID=A0A5S9F326_UABAM|nr:hypothetical protein [Candidatus Uabimicrobium amorphum]BBM83821.1 hypothetical protein UABAM_02176 [Candidatus Uabimicrobium amorphum]
MSIQQKKSDYIGSLNQLMTTSCILAGFAFSGLISLPGIEKEMFSKIVHYFSGDLSLGFYASFYTLFFSTICFLSTIMIILVYKVHNFTIPFAKLRNIHLIANLTFSIAISALMMSVISFGIPNYMGICLAIFLGVVVGGSFVWENLLPKQHQKRIQQVEDEQKKEQESAAQSTNEQQEQPSEDTPQDKSDSSESESHTEGSNL